MKISQVQKKTCQIMARRTGLIFDFITVIFLVLIAALMVGVASM